MNLICATAALVVIAGLATAQFPACPVVSTALKTNANPVTAGRGTVIKLAVKATQEDLSVLNLVINLPPNCCTTKSRVRPSLKDTSAMRLRNKPIIEGQNVYWLDIPPSRNNKSYRTFSLFVRVSSSYASAATVPVMAAVYGMNATGAVTCTTTVQPASVSYKILLEVGWLLFKNDQEIYRRFE